MLLATAPVVYSTRVCRAYSRWEVAKLPAVAFLQYAVRTLQPTRRSNEAHHTIDFLFCDRYLTPLRLGWGPGLIENVLNDVHDAVCADVDRPGEFSDGVINNRLSEMTPEVK